MAVTLTSRDLSRLKKAHPDLKKIVARAAEITTIPFVVLQADRTIEQQRANVKAGVSWTMKSRHLISRDGMVYAVDIAPLGPDGNVSWSWPLYRKLAPIMKKAAKDMKIPVEWGGDWTKNKDGPHWQLPWKLYPGK